MSGRMTITYKLAVPTILATFIILLSSLANLGNMCGSLASSLPLRWCHIAMTQ